ncbi:MAG TPA: SIMPL domain-containing protein [Pyrinomonadaceae bacterium]|jgi:hypothetical protein
MKKQIRVLVSVVVLTLLLSSGVVEAARRQATTARELTVRGRLAQTTDERDWLIAGASRTYLILNPQKFQNETWFREGTEVDATGVERSGTSTMYPKGTPFEVRSMRPRDGASNDGATVTGGASARALTRVSVTGDAIVQAQPDTAIVSIAVLTQNASASEAQAENASRTDAVMRAVRAAAGADAEVKTGGYSLQPQYAYKEGQSPTITSYIARNSVVVTMSELGRVGAVIDAASRAGANSVDNLQFTLRRDKLARTQALTEATQEALSKAKVIAQALGGRVVRIYEVQEGGASRPPIIYTKQMEMSRTSMADAPPTPVEPGSLDITSQVQLVAEIETQP